jgi:hypothetical protein
MANLAGFDVCMAIGPSGLGQVLQSQLQPPARSALTGVPVPLTGAPTSTLDVESFTIQPGASIDGAQHRATVAASGTADLRMSVNGTGLVTAPPGVTIPAGVSSVPVSASFAVSATLAVTITRASGANQVVIDQALVAVTTPGFSQSAVASDLAQQLTTKLNALIAGITGVTLQAAQVTAAANALAADIAGQIAGVVTSRLRGIFPLPFPFSMPPVNASAFCGIGLHDVQIALLPAGSGTDPCLAIATKQMPGTSGTIGQLASPLPAGEPAGLFFDNLFLTSAIGCTLRHAPQFTGLPNPTGPTATDPCCHWDNINVQSVMNNQVFNVHKASVCLDSSNASDKRFAVHLEMTTSGTGWDATVNVDFGIRLGLQGKTVVPIVEQPVVDPHISFAWWVIAIGILLVAVIALIAAALAALVAAIIAAIASITISLVATAGIAGAIGAIVGIAIVAAINDALTSSLTNTVRAAANAAGSGLSALSVIPDELQALFGQVDASVLHFDDVEVLGPLVVKPPANEPAILVVADLLVSIDQAVDLDRGTIVPVSDPGCDLMWHRVGLTSGGALAAAAPSSAAAVLPGRPDLGGIVSAFPPILEARRPAGLVAVTSSFLGLHLTQVRSLPFGFGGGGASESRIPQAAAEPERPLVAGVLTGEGRYAKCAFWRDLADRLHVRFTLWDTPARVRVVPRWTAVRGEQVAATPVWTVYQVSRTGTFRAIPITLHAPVAYTWLWNGTPIQDGGGPLPGGVSSTQVGADWCALHTDFGVALDGELCVSATDRFGVSATVCQQLHVSGTDRVSNIVAVPAVETTLAPVAPSPSPGPTLPPLDEQFRSRLAELAGG